MDQLTDQLAGTGAQAQSQHGMPGGNHYVFIFLYSPDIRQPICRTGAIAIPYFFRGRHRDVEFGKEPFDSIEDPLHAVIAGRSRDRRDLHGPSETDLITVHRGNSSPSFYQDPRVVDTPGRIFQGYGIPPAGHEGQAGTDHGGHFPAPGSCSQHDGITSITILIYDHPLPEPTLHSQNHYSFI